MSSLFRGHLGMPIFRSLLALPFCLRAVTAVPAEDNGAAMVLRYVVCAARAPQASIEIHL